jgi:putative transposase
MHPVLRVTRQCDLLDLRRASFYYAPMPVGDEELVLMRLPDEQYTATPFYGSRGFRWR